METTATPQQYGSLLRTYLSVKQLIAFNVAFVVILTIYIVADASSLAYLQFTVDKDGESIFYFDFYLSITGSMKNLWDSGSYFLSILLFIFSFILPYIQLTLLVLCLWLTFAPQKKSEIFHTIEITAKIPLLNVFYIICFANLLAQNMEFTLLSADYSGFISIDLQFGIVVFALVTIVLILTTVALNYFHTQSLMKFKAFASEDGQWCKCHKPLLCHPKISWTNVALLILLILTCVCAVLTYATPLITVDFHAGMAEYMSHPRREYTFIDIGTFGIDQSSVSMVLISIIYVGLVVIIPLFLCLTLFILWTVPLPKRFQRQNLRFFVWSLFSFHCLDIMFVIAISIAYEFPDLYNYLLFDEYSEYCVEYLSYLDETCPSLKITIGAAMWLCLVTVTGLTVVIWYTVFESTKDGKGNVTDQEYTHSEIQPLHSSEMPTEQDNADIYVAI